VEDAVLSGWGKNPVYSYRSSRPHPCRRKTWHGAALDSWFSHLTVEVPSEDSSYEWLDTVDEIEYATLK
jgi:hypothetical protein